MTKADFLQEQAAKSNSTLEDFARMNIDAMPCDCGTVRCEGWWLVVRELKKIEGETKMSNPLQDAIDSIPAVVANQADATRDIKDFQRE